MKKKKLDPFKPSERAIALFDEAHICQLNANHYLDRQRMLIDAAWEEVHTKNPETVGRQDLQYQGSTRLVSVKYKAKQS